MVDDIPSCFFFFFLGGRDLYKPTKIKLIDMGATLPVTNQRKRQRLRGRLGTSGMGQSGLRCLKI
jgi:hypothetical protein